MSTNMERWFTELETTDTGQSVATLCEENEHGDDTFCCLGIGCELAVKDKAVGAGNSGNQRFYDGQWSLPPLSFAKWLGLRVPRSDAESFDLHLLDPDGGDLLDREGSEVTASFLNDECGLSFKQIAQMLRTHEVRVVTHL